MKKAMVHLVAAAALAAANAFAQPAVVEAVQYPAWLERGGQAVPLAPGTALQPQDRLRTGANARIQLKMAEGSAVKLGENAQFSIDKSETRGIFRATLSVLSGAFRYTTDALRKSQKRDVTIKVKNVTAGIRGTDVWGKSTDERDLVCLLEGKVAVGSEGHPTVTLDQPLDFYQKPRDGAPAVAKVDEKQIAIWSLETELAKDGPAARVGGKWRVTAATFSTRDEARALTRALRSSGYPAEVAGREGEFTVAIPGLAGESEARALLASLRNVKGVTNPAINQVP
jgi:hypothetical protein